MREAIVAADPGVKGKIDRLGNFADGAGRYLIHPICCTGGRPICGCFTAASTARRVAVADRAACFVIGDDEAQRKNPRPLALKRR